MSSLAISTRFPSYQEFETQLPAVLERHLSKVLANITWKYLDLSILDDDDLVKKGSELNENIKINPRQSIFHKEPKSYFFGDLSRVLIMGKMTKEIFSYVQKDSSKFHFAWRESDQLHDPRTVSILSVDLIKKNSPELDAEIQHLGMEVERRCATNSLPCKFLCHIIDNYPTQQEFKLLQEDLDTFNRLKRESVENALESTNRGDFDKNDLQDVCSEQTPTNKRKRVGKNEQTEKAPKRPKNDFFGHEKVADGDISKILAASKDYLRREAEKAVLFVMKKFQ